MFCVKMRRARRVLHVGYQLIMPQLVPQCARARIRRAKAGSRCPFTDSVNLGRQPSEINPWGDNLPVTKMELWTHLNAT